MFQHIFKLIWKKKKSNFLMMLEIFISFLILFAVWSLSVYTYRNYGTPAGLSTDNVWTVYLNFNTSNDTLRGIYKDLVRQQLKSDPQVAAFSFYSSNIPFGNSHMIGGTSYQGREVSTDMMFVDATLPAVLGLTLKSGQWFRPEDTLGGVIPVVISQHLATDLFGQEEPIGQRLGQEFGSEKNKQKVVGVVEHYRHSSSFQADGNVLFTPAGRSESTFLVKVKPPADNADYEAKLADNLQRLGKDWTVEIQHSDNMKVTKDQMVLIPILILAIVCGFLIFNVALGLFGVLFQNISRRKGEIGIRRAVGATKNHIWRYFVGETLVIATFGVILGVFFAVQIPILHVLDVESSVYVWGIVLADIIHLPDRGGLRFLSQPPGGGYLPGGGFARRVGK